MIRQKNVLGNSRPSASSTVHKVKKKKKHSSLKQIFILSRDALMERKGRSALTILMVLVGGALMVTINGMSGGSAAFANKQLVSLAPNVIFVSPGSKSKTFQEAPGLATQAPSLAPFLFFEDNSPYCVRCGTNTISDSSKTYSFEGSASNE